MLTLAIIKGFFSHWVGISFLVILLAVGGYAAIERHEVNSLSKTITTQDQTIGSLKANIAQWTGAASDCSASVANAAAASSEASANSVEAVSEAAVATAPKKTFAKKILDQKPTSSDDYTASNTLMGQLIDQRQSELAGAQK
jgi:hypothetical protein